MRAPDFEMLVFKRGKNLGLFVGRSCPPAFQVGK